MIFGASSAGLFLLLMIALCVRKYVKEKTNRTTVKLHGGKDALLDKEFEGGSRRIRDNGFTTEVDMLRALKRNYPECTGVQFRDNVDNYHGQGIIIVFNDRENKITTYHGYISKAPDPAQRPPVSELFIHSTNNPPSTAIDRIVITEKQFPSEVSKALSPHVTLSAAILVTPDTPDNKPYEPPVLNAQRRDAATSFNEIP